jgi:DNA-binding Xre family transcriptional regulator
MAKLIDCGERLRSLQNQHQISSIMLAERLGITPQQITRWRHSENLKMHTIQQLCEGLGIKVSDFVGA